MIVQLESCTSFPIARRSSTTRKAHGVFAFSCSLLHAGVQQKWFSLRGIYSYALPRHHTSRPAAVVPLAIVVVPRPAKLVKPDTSCFHDDRLRGENIVCAIGVC